MTAMLSVGVTTEQGKADVLAFKGWLQETLNSTKFKISPANLGTLDVKVDEGVLTKSINDALSKRHNIGINSGELTVLVQKALVSAFSIKQVVSVKADHLSDQLTVAITKAMTGSGSGYKVRIDESHIREQVASAIRKGSLAAGATIGPAIAGTQTPTPAIVQTAGVTSAGQATPSQIAEMMRQSLVPLLNRFDQIAKTGGSPGESKKLNSNTRSARFGLSVRDPATGESLNVSQTVDPDVAQRVIDEKRASQSILKNEKDADKAWNAYKDQQAAEAKAQRDRAFALAESDQSQHIKKLTKAESEELKSAIKQRLADNKSANDAGIKQSEDYFANERAIQRGRVQYASTVAGDIRNEVAADKARELAFRKAEGSKVDAFALAENEARKKELADRAALEKQYGEAVNRESRAVHNAAIKERDAQLLAMSEQERKREELIKRRVASELALARVEAKKRYTGDGVNIAAVQSVADKAGGIDRVAPYLGPQAALYSLRETLPQYTKPVAVDPAIVARRALIAQSYERAKAEASGSYFGQGPKIAAAQAISNQFPKEHVEDFLGKRGYLLQQSGDLDKYSKALRDTTHHAELTRQAHQQMGRAMWDAHSAARGLAGSLGAMWLTWGSVAPLVAAAAIGGALRSVFTTGKDVGYQLTFVAALAGESVVPLNKFGDAVRGNLVPPREAAEGMRALAQNGLDVQESLKALPTVLRLATVGEMSIGDAALGATGVMKAFNLTIDDLGRVSDVFAKAAAISNTSVQGMVESMRQASTVSDMYGVSIEETAASLAVMAKRNIYGTAAGTAFRNMMKEVATPTDNAKRSIKALGIEFYDSTGKLKPYGDLLVEVKNKTELLNQKSKLELLNNIFGERGGKAINAILSDFELYNKSLDELKNKSQGFTQTVNQMLSESTQGRIKSLFSEFQVVSLTAFDQVSNSANTFVESLRRIISQPEFVQGLVALVNNVGVLTTALVDNVALIGQGLAVWGAYKLAIGFVTLGMQAYSVSQAAATAATAVGTVATAESSIALGAQAVAANTAKVAFLGLSVSVRTAAAVMTFGLSLVASLAVGWLLFSDHTDKAKAALEANSLTLSRNNEELGRELTKLRENNKELSLRNSLMSQGLTYQQATDAAKKAVGDNSNSDRRKELTDALGAQQSRVDTLRGQVPSGPGDKRDYGPGWYVKTKKSDLEDAMKVLDATKRNLALYESNVELASQAARETSIRSINGTRGNLKKEAEEFNKDFNNFSKDSRTKYKGIDLTIGQGRDESNDSFRKRLDENKRQFEAVKFDVKVPDPRDQKLELDAQKAETQGIINTLKDREAAFKENMAFTTKMNNYRFQAYALGDTVSGVLSEIQAQNDLTGALYLQEQAIATLNEEKKKYSGKEGKSEIERIENEIESRTRASQALQTEIEHRTVLAGLKAQESSRRGDQDFKQTLNKLAVGDAKASITAERGFTEKTSPAGRAAYAGAYDSRISAYADAINTQSGKVAELEGSLSTIKGLKSAMAGDDEESIAKYDMLLNTTTALVEKERERLGILEKAAASSGDAAGKRAQELVAASQTAGYGWDKFWAEYSNNAATNSKLVEDLLGKTTGTISSQFEQMAVSGKFSFKGLMASILAEASKMLMSKVITQLLQLGASLFSPGGGYSYNDGVGTTNAAGISGGRAGGGQMMAGSAYRVVEGAPEIYQDARTGNQYVMSGESGGQIKRMQQVDRGYSPVPGSSQGSGVSASGGGMQVSISMPITIMQDGSSKQSVESSDQNASKLGLALQNSVREVLVREKRPGGILYEMVG